MRLKTFALTFIIAVLAAIDAAAAEPLKLWYSAPASEWVEALPMGNSRMGAMIFGGVDSERIQLNDETFWSGSPYNNNNPEGLKHLPEDAKPPIPEG